MSGVVSRYVARALAQLRSLAGVSPSTTAARIPGMPSDVTIRSWSAASARVGERYSAVPPPSTRVSAGSR